MERIEDLLGIEKPIFQGGMANIATHKLASAVSNAGGLGTIGSGGWDVDKVRFEIQETKKLTDKPMKKLLTVSRFKSITNATIALRVAVAFGCRRTTVQVTSFGPRK